MQYFDLTDLMHLYRSGGVRSLTVTEVGDKYQIHVTTEQGSGKLRDASLERDIEFPTPQRAAAYLVEQGFQGSSQSPSVAHDNWVRTKIQASLDGLRDGTNAVYLEEEWAEIRRSRKAKLGA
jgi:hypothetical protein